MQRTIDELARLQGRVYVYLTDAAVGAAFLRQAEAEGFTFTDGAKPTARHASEIMAVNRDRTLNYVGTNGRIAFGSGIKTAGGERLLRVDYAQYAAGEAAFLL